MAATLQRSRRRTILEGLCSIFCDAELNVNVHECALGRTASARWRWLRREQRVTTRRTMGMVHGAVAYVMPISAATGQIKEAWTEVQQSRTPEISASLRDSDGNFLSCQSPDKTITLPGEWAVPIQFDPIPRIRFASLLDRLFLGI